MAGPMTLKKMNKSMSKIMIKIMNQAIILAMKYHKVKAKMNKLLKSNQES